MSTLHSAKFSQDDTFKILVATDCHLGYECSKKKGVQVEDSFVTFEEILKYGRDHEVDFILLGGDLFHDAKPSHSVILRCMELLRKYCLGSRETKIQFLSDPDEVFKHCAQKRVNYEDPNLNVSMPVFSIHGNHDDPNFGTVGTMDILSASGLINYFGKMTNLKEINVLPIILKKGNSHLALYGLSYINDERLSRLMRDGKVNMLCSEEVPDCFNLLVLHQNRAVHSLYAHIPEDKLPSFLHFIMWGHEHQCRIEPEMIPGPDYYVSQPGSSVATSLCEAEAVPKHVGLLSINGINFKLKKLKLKTVRPFVFDTLVLQEHNFKSNVTKSTSEYVYEYVDEYIEHYLMPKAAEQLTGHPKQPLQPLLRLRILYNNDAQLFDTIRLAQKYCDEVANPTDIILFRKDTSERKCKTDVHKPQDGDDSDIADIFSSEDRDWCRTVQGGIKHHFSLPQNKDKLTVLSVTGLNEALCCFLEKSDTDAFSEIVRHQTRKTRSYLEELDIDPTTEKIRKVLKDLSGERGCKKEVEERQEALDVLTSTTRKRTTYENDIEETILSDDEEETIPVRRNMKTSTPAIGKGSTTRPRGGKTTAKQKVPAAASKKSKPGKLQLAQSNVQDSLSKFLKQSQSSRNSAAFDDNSTDSDSD